MASSPTSSSADGADGSSGFLKLVWADRGIQMALGQMRIRMGRNQTNDIQIIDPLVSSNHAVVELDGCLVDNGSTNGTCINGVQVEYKRKYPLKVGDIILLGDTRLVVEQGKPFEGRDGDHADDTRGSDSDSEHDHSAGANNSKRPNGTASGPAGAGASAAPDADLEDTDEMPGLVIPAGGNRTLLRPRANTAIRGPKENQRISSPMRADSKKNEANVSGSYAKNASRIRFFSPSDYSEMLNESNRVARLLREYEVRRDTPIIFTDAADADVQVPEGYEAVFVNGDIQNRGARAFRLNGSNVVKNEKRRVQVGDVLVLGDVRFRFDRAPGPTSCSQCEISRKRGAEDAKTIHELREETFAWKFQVLYGSENSEKFERTHTKRLHESIQELRRRLDHEVRQRQGLEQSLQYYEQRFTSAQPLSTDGAAAPSLGGPPVMSKDEERVEIARLVRALAESNMLVEQRNHDLEALQVEKDATVAQAKQLQAELAKAGEALNKVPRSDSNMRPGSQDTSPQGSPPLSPRRSSAPAGGRKPVTTTKPAVSPRSPPPNEDDEYTNIRRPLNSIFDEPPEEKDSDEDSNALDDFDVDDQRIASMQAASAPSSMQLPVGVEFRDGRWVKLTPGDNDDAAFDDIAPASPSAHTADQLTELKAQVEQLNTELAELRKNMADKESAWEDLKARGVHRIKQLEAELAVARSSPQTEDGAAPDGQGPQVHVSFDESSARASGSDAASVPAAQYGYQLFAAEELKANASDVSASGLEHRWNELSSDQQGAYAARAMSELNRPDAENGAAAAGSAAGDGSSNVVFPSVHQASRAERKFGGPGASPKLGGKQKTLIFTPKARSASRSRSSSLHRLSSVAGVSCPQTEVFPLLTQALGAHGSIRTILTAAPAMVEALSSSLAAIAQAQVTISDVYAQFLARKPSFADLYHKWRAASDAVLNTDSRADVARFVRKQKERLSVAGTVAAEAQALLGELSSLSAAHEHLLLALPVRVPEITTRAVTEPASGTASATATPPPPKGTHRPATVGGARPKAAAAVLPVIQVQAHGIEEPIVAAQKAHAAALNSLAGEHSGLESLITEAHAGLSSSTSDTGDLLTTSSSSRNHSPSVSSHSLSVDPSLPASTSVESVTSVSAGVASGWSLGALSAVMPALPQLPPTLPSLAITHPRLPDLEQQVRQADAVASQLNQYSFAQLWSARNQSPEEVLSTVSAASAWLETVRQADVDSRSVVAAMLETVDTFESSAAGWLRTVREEIVLRWAGPYLSYVSAVRRALQDAHGWMQNERARIVSLQETMEHVSSAVTRVIDIVSRDPSTSASAFADTSADGKESSGTSLLSLSQHAVSELRTLAHQDVPELLSCFPQVLQLRGFPSDLPPAVRSKGVAPFLYFPPSFLRVESVSAAYEIIHTVGHHRLPSRGQVLSPTAGGPASRYKPLPTTSAAVHKPSHQSCTLLCYTSSPVSSSDHVFADPSHVPHGQTVPFALRAASALYQLSLLRHPFVLSIDAVIRDADVESTAVSEIVFAQCPRVLCDLSQRLREWTSLPDGVDLPSLLTFDTLRAQLTGIAEAVAYGHSQGIVHGQLGPSAVLVKETGEAVLAHYGLPFALPTLRTADDASFQAPEVLAGSRPTCSSDVYSLGRLLERVITTYCTEAHVPVPDAATALMSTMIQTEAKLRPSVDALVCHPFFQIASVTSSASLIGASASHAYEAMVRSLRSLRVDLAEHLPARELEVARGPLLFAVAAGALLEDDEAADIASIPPVEVELLKALDQTRGASSDVKQPLRVRFTNEASIEPTVALRQMYVAYFTDALIAVPASVSDKALFVPAGDHPTHFRRVLPRRGAATHELHWFGQLLAKLLLDGVSVAVLHRLPTLLLRCLLCPPAASSDGLPSFKRVPLNFRDFEEVFGPEEASRLELLFRSSLQKSSQSAGGVEASSDKHTLSRAAQKRHKKGRRPEVAVPAARSVSASSSGDQLSAADVDSFIQKRLYDDLIGTRLKEIQHIWLGFHSAGFARLHAILQQCCTSENGFCLLGCLLAGPSGSYLHSCLAAEQIALIGFPSPPAGEVSLRNVVTQALSGFGPCETATFLRAATGFSSLKLGRQHKPLTIQFDALAPVDSVRFSPSVNRVTVGSVSDSSVEHVQRVLLSLSSVIDS